MLNFNNKIYNFFKNKNSDFFLYLISFLESIFFPIPTDAFLIPKALINKDRAIKLGIYTTIFSVLGGIVGYSIGYFFYDEIGIRIIDEFNLTDQFNSFSQSINDYGFLFIFIAGFTPIPYKIAAITSGFVNLPLLGFILFSLLSRGLRFMTEVILCMFLGKKAEDIIKNYSFIVTILLIILLIFIFLFKRYYDG